MNAQLGEALKKDAIDATEAANDLWVTTTLQVVRDLCSARQEFTTDDVWLYNEMIPNEPRAMGAVMRKAVKEKLCSATDRTVLSKRATCHRRPVRVWKSLVFVP